MVSSSTLVRTPTVLLAAPIKRLNQPMHAEQHSSKQYAAVEETEAAVGQVVLPAVAVAAVVVAAEETEVAAAVVEAAVVAAEVDNVSYATATVISGH